MNLRYYINRLREELELRIVSKRIAGYSDHNHVPQYFILSSGRSGSTLLRKLIVENSDSYIPPESGDLVVQAAKILLLKRRISWSHKVERIMALIEELNINEYWKLDLNAVRGNLINLSKSQQNFHTVIEILYQTAGQQKSYKLIGDKTPFLTLRVEWLIRLFPNAKFIYVLRDGRDVVVSRMNAFDETAEQAAQRWLWSVNELEKMKNSNVQLLRICYEDLVINQLEILKKVFNFLGLQLEKSAHQVNLGDDSLEHHQNLSRPIFNTSIDNWRTKLSSADQAKLDVILSQKLNEYGYATKDI